MVMDAMRNSPEQERRALQEFWFECDELTLIGVPNTEWFAWCSVEADEDLEGRIVFTAVPKYVEMRLKDGTVVTEISASMLRKDTLAIVQDFCTDQLRENP